MPSIHSLNDDSMQSSCGTYWSYNADINVDTPTTMDSNNFEMIDLPVSETEPFQVVFTDLAITTEERYLESILSQDDNDATKMPLPTTTRYHERKSREEPAQEAQSFLESFSTLEESDVDNMELRKLRKILRHQISKKNQQKEVEPALGLESEEHISKLTVKEIKKILSDKAIETKGLYEKKDLQQKLIQLWKHLNKSAGEVPVAERCLICMDSRIDCVFLECGHQATCTECGKIIKDCPICRMYITRVVRTYRP